MWRHKFYKHAPSQLWLCLWYFSSSTIHATDNTHCVPHVVNCKSVRYVYFKLWENNAGVCTDWAQDSASHSVSLLMPHADGRACRLPIYSLRMHACSLHGTTLHRRPFPPNVRTCPLCLRRLHFNGGNRLQVSTKHSVTFVPFEDTPTPYFVFSRTMDKKILGMWSSEVEATLKPYSV
jgi:hypothetical protein